MLLETLEKPLESTIAPGETLDRSPTIQLDEFRIRELWCKGMLPDLAYVAFALELFPKANLEVSRFASEWSVTELSEYQQENGWKSKRLKVRSVLNALCILNDRNMGDTDFSVRVNQLNLFDA